MIKIFIGFAFLFSIYSCQNNTNSNITPANSTLQSTSQHLSFDSLDLDTSYARGIYRPDSVNSFFLKADDTLWSYVMRAFIRSNKKEVFSIDSLKSILNKAEYNLAERKESLFGTKKEFNKRYNFQLRLGKEIKLITFFEYWFEGKKYQSPMRMHIN